MGAPMIRTTTAALMAGPLLAACSAPTQPADQAEPAPAAAGEAAPAPDPAATGAAPAVRTFRDWTAVCDNGNRCVALTGGGPGDAWLRVEMEAGPAARPVVTFGAEDFRSGERAAAPALAVDGRAVAADGTAVQALGQGRRATVTAFGRQRPVSLSGAAAAFLWIDERQGRLDTPAALIRRGDRPAGAVPEGPARPRVTAVRVPGGGVGEERAVPPTLEALPAVQECRVDVPDGQARTWRIGVDVLLWEVPCWRGAYNAGARLFVAGPDGADARALGLPTAAGEPTRFTVNGDFDPETGLLTSFDKGRGLGDCGHARTWAWTGRGFVLTREAAMEDCRGITAEDWPVLYEAAVE